MFAGNPAGPTPAGVVTDTTAAGGEILPQVYAELRKLAAAKLAREQAASTLQPTALVHEAWLRLGGEGAAWKSRAQFFAAAAEAMRRILIEAARRRAAVRHGAGWERVGLEQADAGSATAAGDAKLLRLDEALAELAATEPRKAELVKLWYFTGMTVAEAAEALGVSVRTAERDWHYARAWLMREMERREER